jgi:hypothetical protein
MACLGVLAFPHKCRAVVRAGDECGLRRVARHAGHGSAVGVIDAQQGRRLHQVPHEDLG